jgi:hypothetical protein
MKKNPTTIHKVIRPLFADARWAQRDQTGGIIEGERELPPPHRNRGRRALRITEMLLYTSQATGILISSIFFSKEKSRICGFL